MANLAETAVTVVASYYEGGLQNKDYVTKKVTLVLSGQGTKTAGSQITATVLGLASIVKCSNFIKSDDAVIYTAAPSVDGSLLLLDTVGTTGGVPDAVTATVTGTVTGQPYAAY